jgi:hypothetical protein
MTFGKFGFIVGAALAFAAASQGDEQAFIKDVMQGNIAEIRPASSRHNGRRTQTSASSPRCCARIIEPRCNAQ